jgi:exoribonuclease R
LVKELGKDSDIGAQTEAILCDYDVDTSDFGESVEKCLPGQFRQGILTEEACRAYASYNGD